ncbi:MAG: acyl-CoA dehydrogenase family protein [Gammaproteobacteria bacterium]|nr:acyl-CoA dehydrogenase family protein [Gammaproteobacteria bacterium]
MHLTEEHKAIQTVAKKFAEEHIAPFAGEWEKNHAFPREVFRELGKLGLMGMLVPEEWGGSGTGLVALALVMEEIASAHAACATVMGVNNGVVCLPILTYGSPFQKETFLKKLARGEFVGAFCLSEPQAGSDASALQTKAIKDGDFYILNGVKQFITSGKNGDIAIVFAMTAPSLGKNGMSAFIVPITTPGYRAVRLEDKMGQNASDTAQIVLENCRIPQNYLLGKEGEGYKIALSNLEGGRIGVAAQSVGIARAAFEAALVYARERKAFGKTLFEHPPVAFALADMATNLEAARLLYLNAAFLKESGKPSLKQASMAKLFASEMAEKVCSQAIQIHGGYGYLKDFPVERYYRDVRVTQIYEGTSEVQKMVISRALKGGVRI